MSNYNSIKATINANIKTNGNEEITGSVLNSVLTAMVNALGAGYLYAGVATPSINPGAPDSKVFFLAATSGTYTNFGGISLDNGEVAILKWDSSWHKEQTGIATMSQVVSLKKELGQILPLGVDGNEILTKEQYIETDTYIDGANARIQTHQGWNMYIIPVNVGEKYSYHPVQKNVNYAFFLLDSNMIAVGAYGATIQAISGQPFPADNLYGNMVFQIPNGVSFVAFNKDINSVGNPVLFKGDTQASVEVFVESIGGKLIKATNGLSNRDVVILETLAAEAVTKTENAYKWSTGSPSNTLGGLTNHYYLFVSPDTEHVGYLNKLYFSSSASAAYTLRFGIYKKVYSAGEFASVETILEDSIQVSSGQSVIDFSSRQIFMQKDYLLGIVMDSSLKNQIKFRVDNTQGYDWYDVTGASFYDGKLVVNFNYDIQYLSFEDEQGNVPIEDANVVILGDSITWLGGDDCNGRDNPSRGWTTYFKNKLLPKSIASYARSGATWSHTANTQYNITQNTGALSDDNVIYNQINRLIAAVNGRTQETPDLIIIAAGTNDAWYPSARPNALSVDADTEFANTDGYITSQAVNTLTSIAAAMRYDIELLKTNFPNCQIIVTTPLQSTGFTLTRCFDVGKVIRDCAKYLSIECIDQGADAGIYRAQEKTAFLFTYDGTHTSALGAKMVGQFIAQRVICCYRDKIN